MTTDFVFLHGGGRGGWCWEPTIEEMVRQGHPNLGKLASLDFPGHGRKKEVSDKDCTVAGYVESVVRDITEKDLHNIVLVGHSYAGLIIPYVVKRMTERIKRTVFMACAVPPEGKSLRDLLIMMGKMWPDTRLDSHSAKARFAGEWDLERTSRRLGPERAKWLLENLEREFAVPYIVPGSEPVTREGFAGLAPISWVVLTRDRSMPPRWQRAFAHWLDGDRVEVQEVDGEHDAMISKPGSVATAMLRYAN